MSRTAEPTAVRERDEVKAAREKDDAPESGAKAKEAKDVKETPKAGGDGKAVDARVPRTPQQETALKRALEQVEKQFGKGAILRLGDRQIQPIEAIPTGSLSLDLALGVGGVPKGRIVEIFGPESSGKTTLALHIIASAQKKGGNVVFIDAEHALDPAYAERLGVDLKSLYISQPDTGEQALEIADVLVRSNSVDAIVIDSVAALVPKAELEGQMGDQHVGLQARLMSQALRKLTAVVHQSNAVIIFINQIREKIGVMFGSPETTPGGRALKFYASVRIDVRRISTIKQGEESVGNHVQAKVVKNKVAPPFKKVEFDILFGKGISRAGDSLDLGASLGVAERSGAWYSFGKTQLGAGRDKSIAFLQENPSVLEALEKAIREKAAAGPAEE